MFQQKLTRKHTPNFYSFTGSRVRRNSTANEVYVTTVTVQSCDDRDTGDRRPAKIK